MMEVLDDAGYTAVLGTNCEQTYDRYLRLGEQVRVDHARSTSVVGPKQTGVGEGYFVTIAQHLVRRRRGGRDDAVPGAEVQARHRRAAVDRPTSIVRPMVNRDTAFFWEGTPAGELRIQRCNACGALRHPPGPACPACDALDRGLRRGRRPRHGLLVRRAPRTRRSRARSCRS